MARIQNTFNLKLGIVSYLHNGKIYKAQIADTTNIWDGDHEKTYMNVLEWIECLQRKYPLLNQQSAVTITAHEYFKRTQQTSNKEKKMPKSPLSPTPFRFRSYGCDDDIYDYNDNDSGSESDDDNDMRINRTCYPNASADDDTYNDIDYN